MTGKSINCVNTSDFTNACYICRRTELDLERLINVDTDKLTSQREILNDREIEFTRLSNQLSDEVTKKYKGIIIEMEGTQPINYDVATVKKHYKEFVEGIPNLSEIIEFYDEYFEGNDKVFIQDIKHHIIKTIDDIKTINEEINYNPHIVRNQKLKNINILKNEIIAFRKQINNQIIIDNPISINLNKHTITIIDTKPRENKSESPIAMKTIDILLCEICSQLLFNMKKNVEKNNDVSDLNNVYIDGSDEDDDGHSGEKEDDPEIGFTENDGYFEVG